MDAGSGGDFGEVCVRETDPKREIGHLGNRCIELKGKKLTFRKNKK
jgi:hypothetical protein